MPARDRWPPASDRASVFADSSTRGGGAVPRLQPSWSTSGCASSTVAAFGATTAWPWWRSAATGGASCRRQSDLDVLLLHDGRTDIAGIAERIWYPIWDEGLKLGHSVRTIKEALSLAADDLDTATVAAVESATSPATRRSPTTWATRRWRCGEAGEAVAGRD